MDTTKESELERGLSAWTFFFGEPEKEVEKKEERGENEQGFLGLVCSWIKRMSGTPFKYATLRKHDQSTDVRISGFIPYKHISFCMNTKEPYTYEYQGSGCWKCTCPTQPICSDKGVSSSFTIEASKAELTRIKNLIIEDVLCTAIQSLHESVTRKILVPTTSSSIDELVAAATSHAEHASPCVILTRQTTLPLDGLEVCVNQVWWTEYKYKEHCLVTLRPDSFRTFIGVDLIDTNTVLVWKQDACLKFYSSCIDTSTASVDGFSYVLDFYHNTFMSGTVTELYLS